MALEVVAKYINRDYIKLCIQSYFLCVYACVCACMYVSIRSYVHVSVRVFGLPSVCHSYLCTSAYPFRGSNEWESILEVRMVCVLG